jgi:uridine kinase
MDKKSSNKKAIKEEKISSESSSDDKSDDEVIEKDPNAPMGYTIKRKQNKELVHKSRLLKNNSNFIMVSGSTGTGKSTLLLALLVCFSNKVKHIVLASAKMVDDAHKSIEKYCKKESIEFHYVHDADQCNNTLADILDSKKESEHVIVIFDDFNINFTSQGNDPLNQIIIKVFALLRSQNCSGIIVTQTYYNVPTKVRENCNMRIVFKMDNVHSHRALINDIEGLFYDGNNENEVRRDLKALYNKIFMEPYKFMIILSHPPPQIRIGWHDIVYPPDQAGYIEGGELKPKKKRQISKPIARKRELYRTAVDLGLPTYYWKRITVPQLEHFVKVKSAQGQKGNGNTAPEIDKIIEGAGDDEDTIERLNSKLGHHIRQYKRKGNPNNLTYISDLCNKLSEKGMPIQQIRYILKHTNMTDFIEI